jgi:hypothetical protein
MTREDCIGWQALAHGGQQYAVKTSAMDANFGLRIARELPARLREQPLSEAVEEHAFAIFYSGRGNLRSETECFQLSHPVRQQRDPHTDLTQLWGCLVDSRVETMAVKSQREREARNPAADDGDIRCWPVHGFRVAPDAQTYA